METVFAKRDCDALVFQGSAKGFNEPLQFLVLQNAGQPGVMAVNLADPEADSPAGLFIELTALDDQTNMEPGSALRDASLEILRQIPSSSWRNVSGEEFQIYTPFVTNAQQLRQVRDTEASNPLIHYLWQRAAKVNPALRFRAPLYEIGALDAHGMYNNHLKLIFRNAFERNCDWQQTLAHELVHANLDGSIGKSKFMQQLIPYLQQQHPTLFQLTLPEMYHFEQEMTAQDSDAQYVEEGLAFLVGSLATHKMQVIYFPGADEPIWTSDVEMLAAADLVPSWMSPSAMGYTEERITQPYYELVTQAAAQSH
jgi:hypothetical protein